jgi:predicted transcriptional regulator
MFGNTRSLKLQVEEPFTNRSRLSIIYHILWICHDTQVSQTQLMYKANLSYFQLKKYVNTLMIKGLLQETIQDEKKSYRCTNSYLFRDEPMTKQRMSIEWVRRVNALKRQGFDVHVTTDADGVMIHIRKKPSDRIKAY